MANVQKQSPKGDLPKYWFQAYLIITFIGWSAAAYFLYKATRP